MENHGVQDSWTERYVINNGLIADFSVRLVWCFKSGEILFCDDWSGALVLYDPKDGSVRKRHTRKLDFSSSEAFYFESLVHLNSNTYAGRRRRGISRNMNNNRTRLPPRIPLAPRPPFRVGGGSTSSKAAPCKSSGTRPSQK